MDSPVHLSPVTFAVSSRIIAALLSCTLLTTPVWAASSSSLGTVVYPADRAHFGASVASVGATVFQRRQTQHRTIRQRPGPPGAARLLLSSASSATFSQDDASPAATLTFGSAHFFDRQFERFCLARGFCRDSPEHQPAHHRTSHAPESQGIDRQEHSRVTEHQRSKMTCARFRKAPPIASFSIPTLPTRRGRAARAPRARADRR